MSHKAGRLFQCTVRFALVSNTATTRVYIAGIPSNTYGLSWNQYTTGDIGNPGDTIESGQYQYRTFSYLAQTIAPFTCRLEALAFECNHDPHAAGAYIRFGCVSSAKRQGATDGTAAAIWTTQGRIEMLPIQDTDRRHYKSYSAINPDLYEGPPAGQFIEAGDTIGFVSEPFVHRPYPSTIGLITALFRGV